MAVHMKGADPKQGTSDEAVVSTGLVGERRPVTVRDFGLDEDKVSLFDMASMILRQRWVILGLAAGIGGLVFAGTLLGPRRWTVQTSFIPYDASVESPGRLSNLAGQLGLNLDVGVSGHSPEFYAELIRSRQILERLANDTLQVGDTLVTDLSPEWLRDEVVSVTPGAQTGIVEVSVKTRSKELSAEIARRILLLVNEFNLNTRQSQARAKRRFVEQRVIEAQEELREAESRLQSFLQSNRQFQNSPELLFEHDRLQRQVAMRQEVYTSLVQSHQQARIDEMQNTPVITIVEEPEIPKEPDSRRVLFLTTVGLFVGATIGLVVGLVREYIRRQREKESTEVETFLAVWGDTRAEIDAFFRRIWK